PSGGAGSGGTTPALGTGGAPASSGGGSSAGGSASGATANDNGGSGGVPGPDATGGLSSEGGGATGGGATGGAATGGSPQLSEDFQIEVQLASEIMPQAPTTVGVVDWSLPGHTITSARLEFGPDEQYGMQAP